MSEANKSQIGTVAFWSLLLALVSFMGRGVWLASEVHKDVQHIKGEVSRLRNLEERVIRLESRAWNESANHKETANKF